LLGQPRSATTASCRLRDLRSPQCEPSAQPLRWRLEHLGRRIFMRALHPAAENIHRVYARPSIRLLSSGASVFGPAIDWFLANVLLSSGNIQVRQPVGGIARSTTIRHCPQWS
jgi:hypothetical protein